MIEMKFQTKLYLFFALTVILPILVATAVIAILFSRMGNEAASSKLRDAAGIVKAHVQTPGDVLAAELSSRLYNESTLITAVRTGDLPLAQEILQRLSRDLNASQMSLYAADGSLLTQSGTPPAAGCQTGVSIPIKQNGVIQGSVTAIRDIDDGFINNILVETGLPASASCGATLLSSFPASEAPPGETGADPGQPFTEGRVGNADYFLYRYTYTAESFTRPIAFTIGYSMEDIESRRTIVLETGLAMVAFTLLVAALLGYLITRSITNPLHLLTGAVLKAEAGDLSGKVDIHSHDEVGVLARNFNRMISQISSFIEDMRQANDRLLKAFGYAGDLMVSSHDREKLLASVISTAALATNATAASFYLFQGPVETRQMLPVQLLPADFFTDTRSRTIEKVLSKVETGAIRGLVSHPLDHDYVVIVAPVEHQENMYGALVAVVDAGHDTDESSCRILQSLANQAATALENVRLNETLKELVITDSLTGLANVRHFHDVLDNQLEMTRRYHSDLSLLMIDLDNFKRVNDTYGHQAGDEVLRQVGLLLKNGVRKTDLAARYGGEEFAIILPHTSKKTAIDVAEKLRLEADSLRLEDYPQVAVTFSIGVASSPGDADEAEKLLRMADDATYKAKEQGKNQTVAA